MLAVSGSVEAARAGDVGKGFAVVSKDIRSLAQDSGENAGRIKDTVRAIRDQIAAVRRELEQIISAAEMENQKKLRPETDKYWPAPRKFFRRWKRRHVGRSRLRPPPRKRAPRRERRPEPDGRPDRVVRPWLNLSLVKT
jgi:hypothetical protein